MSLENINSRYEAARKLGVLARLPLRRLFRLLSDWRRYESGNPIPSMRISLRTLSPMFDDIHNEAGSVTDYFHQDLWAAKKIYRTRPGRHVDIGSRIDGFIAHLLVFMPVEYVDIRPLPAPVENLTFVQSDAVTLDRFEDGSLPSVSSLNVAEHFGLGRYSDPIDANGCFRFMSALARVLAPGGRLYFSVPLGKERVEFNAHRIFALETVLSHFPALKLVSFSFIDEDIRLHENISPGELPPDPNDGCGLFEFTK